MNQAAQLAQIVADVQQHKAECLECTPTCWQWQAEQTTKAIKLIDQVDALLSAWHTDAATALLAWEREQEWRRLWEEAEREASRTPA